MISSVGAVVAGTDDCLLVVLEFMRDPWQAALAATHGGANAARRAGGFDCSHDTLSGFAASCRRMA